MEKNTDSPKPENNSTDKTKVVNLIGYPYYPISDDFYNQSEKMEDIDPENIDVNKSPNEKEAGSAENEKNFEDDLSGSDLDVPGSETDDEQEINGDEDEENNYYSLGGDEHNDLDEDHWE
jgi:hypothetical protein